MSGANVPRLLLASIFVAFLAACGPMDGGPVDSGFEPTPPDQRSSPFAKDGARCQDRYARGELMKREDAGDPAALRCLLSIRDVGPESFNLRYRIYRIEGVEPEGLDEIVRTHTREELSIRLANVHNFYPELEPVDFAPGSACRTLDPVARELLSRAQPDGRMQCPRWGY